jgi:16S rRNA (adenine1518-N6/adenine1519-N6)-dimethyltransferase
LRHIQRKRFGQHFLHEQRVIDRIIDALALHRDDLVVEIGPGLGALTDQLTSQLHHLQVVEVDRDLAAGLRARYAPGVLTVHEGDALDFDFTTIGQGIRLVGNLPYNISTPLLFHFAEYRDQLRDGLFMLQREVVERMVASPSSPAYGRLSVMLQLDFDMELLFRVAAGSFTPPPKVESAVVRMTPLANPLFKLRDRDLFKHIVTSAFTQRRKTLRNSLREYLLLPDFERIDVDPMARAENLSVADYAKIARYVAMNGNTSGTLQG